MRPALRVYVAGASSEIERAERMIAKVREAGHKITCDWASAMRASGLSNVGLTKEQRRHAARLDLDGVLQANAVVLLVPRRPNVTQGAWWEAGYAEALGKTIVAAGRPEDREYNIFLEGVTEVDEDAEALDILARIADAR